MTLIPRSARATCLMSLLFWLGVFQASQALDYLDNDSLQHTLRALADRHPDLVRLEVVTRSLSRVEVWHVEIGTGTDQERTDRPALLVVAGIEGDDLAGTSCLVHWMEELATKHQTETNIQHLLATTTFHVFPRLNPDGASHYFRRPQSASKVNLRPVDEDHDGLVEEDPPDDLNGDGLITSLRIQDRAGDYILDPADDRLLLRADPLKSELGQWKLLSEGTDNDQDKSWNEDGPGGVNLNRNFPYAYSYFAPWAGRHPVSEPESGALAEFVIRHPNIALAFTFGDADNLGRTPKSDRPQRPPETIHPDDLGYYRVLGEDFRERLGLKKELAARSEPGTFSDWIYFHRGRLSLATRAWTPELQMQRVKPEPAEKKEEEPADDSGPAEQTEKPEKKAPADKRNQEERQFLDWLRQHAPDQFVPWQPIEHPDFPEQRVEVGGYAPYAKLLPPSQFLEELADQHAQFLSSLPARLPRLHLRRSRIEALGNDLYDITIEIENTGFLPTALAQGDLAREVHSTRLFLYLSAQAFLTGAPRTLLGPIAGSGGAKETRYVVYAPDRQQVELELISAFSGSFRHTLPLPKP